MKKVLFILSILLFLFACTKNSETSTTAPPVPVEESTTDLTARLSSHFIKDPKTQAEKDQNTMVGYIIDQDINVQRTASGMYYQIISPGSGKSPTANSNIKVHYEGRLLDGKVFDSSYERGSPITFKLGQVIRGWQEALQMLRPGGKGTFLIPSRLAYGADGFGHDIPPHSPLRFEIELIEVK